MNKFDNKYLQDIGDIVISQERVIYLVLGSNSMGQQHGYTLFDMREYRLEDNEYVQVLARTAVEYVLQHPLQRRKISILTTDLPKSIAFNYWKGSPYIYLMEIPKEDVIAWVVKSKLFDKTLPDVSYLLYDIYTNYREDRQKLGTINDDYFKKFTFYKFQASGRIILSLGINGDCFLYIEVALQQELTDERIEKMIERVNNGKGKILMSSRGLLPTTIKYDYELTDELKENLIKAVNTRGLVV